MIITGFNVIKMYLMFEFNFLIFLYIKSKFQLLKKSSHEKGKFLYSLQNKKKYI